MGSHHNYLPPEWNDEERIGTLMGPMPHDEVAKNARLTFWKAAMHHWCSVTNKLTFTLQECLAAFRRGTQQPRCLADALLHMNSLGEAVPIDELPLGEHEETWVGWGRRVFISTPSRFAWKRVKQAIGVNDLQGRVFVDTKLLQEMCDLVLKLYLESSLGESDALSKPLTFVSLYTVVGNHVGSADNLHLVVESLAYNGRATTLIHNDTTYVKFAMPGDTKKPVISQIEIAENDLHCAETKVEANIAQLEKEVNSLQQEVLMALGAKSKPKALSLLRRKKRAEKSLATQMGALENLTSCLLQVQETQINKQILGAFRVGVEAIRISVAGDNSADSAATTLDELQQVLEECHDVSSLLATGVNSQGADVDDDVLTEELEQLVAHDQDMNRIDQNLAAQMKGMSLPDVPKGNPLASIPESSNPRLSPL